MYLFNKKEYPKATLLGYYDLFLYLILIWYFVFCFNIGLITPKKFPEISSQFYILIFSSVLSIFKLLFD